MKDYNKILVVSCCGNLIALSDYVINQDQIIGRCIYTGLWMGPDDNITINQSSIDYFISYEGDQCAKVLGKMWEMNKLMRADKQRHEDVQNSTIEYMNVGRTTMFEATKMIEKDCENEKQLNASGDLSDVEESKQELEISKDKTSKTKVKANKDNKHDKVGLKETK